MTKIIDLGNGYGRLDEYRSKYASLTFPLTLSRIRRLHTQKDINNTDMFHILGEMGYRLSEIKLFVAVDNITVEQWKARLPNARTI